MKRRRKTIPLPVCGDVDISEIIPIVDHPRFQSLRWKKQLGPSSVIFPNGHHTRFEHSLGTFKITQKRTDRWLVEGVITSQEAWDLSLYGLLHDIGHGPFSHLMDHLCQKNHREVGEEFLLELEESIKGCGGDFQRIKAMFIGLEPLAQAVSKAPEGTDKLDYLSRDAHHTNARVGIAREKLLNYTIWLNGQLVVDSKIVQEAIELQRVYTYMYLQVYKRRPCIINDRYTQKIIARLMTQPELGKVLTEQQLWQLTDSELESMMTRQASSMYGRILKRQLPKTVICLRLEQFAKLERVRNKPIVVRGVSDEIILAFDRFQRPQEALVLEREVAKLVGISEDCVVVAPVVHADYFVPKEIMVDYGQVVEPLSVTWPKHYEALRERANSYRAIRVAVFEEYRDLLAARSDEIIELLLNAASVSV